VEVDESWIDAMEEKEAKEKEAPLNARTKREYHGDIHRYIMIYIYIYIEYICIYIYVCIDITF
jgi:hypothetical protein